MDPTIRQKIDELLKRHRIMTLATLRPDGWPQATTVGYVNEGLSLYFLCGPQSQKARNLARDDRVSLTIDNDSADLMAITGLSMSARAQRVADPAEVGRLLDLLAGRYPEYSEWPLPKPKPEDIYLFRLEPKVISVLDYSKGFGHTNQVTLE